MAITNFTINGKFLLAALEGMPRVGREITAAIDSLLDEPKYSHLSVEVLAPKGSKDKIRLKNIRIREVGKFSGPIWEQIELPFYIGRNYCLHFTGTAPLMRSNGCVVAHDAQFFSTRASHVWKTYLLYRLVTPIVCKTYNDVVTVSEYAKQELKEYKVCARDDIKIIYNGADHVLNRACDKSVLKRFNLDPRGYMLANSYVHPHKNVRILFEALGFPPKLRRPLVLFGNSTRSDYRALGIDVPDDVVFTGRISDEELVGLMKSARMFLFPSTTEGFGLPPVEAMVLGCPTICASAGAMPEVCGLGALYASPHSADDWRNQINILWSNETEWQRLSAAAQLAVSSYTWRNAAKSYLDVICD